MICIVIIISDLKNPIWFRPYNIHTGSQYCRHFTNISGISHAIHHILLVSDKKKPSTNNNIYSENLYLDSNICLETLHQTEKKNKGTIELTYTLKWLAHRLISYNLFPRLKKIKGKWPVTQKNPAAKVIITPHVSHQKTDTPIRELHF